MTKRIILTMLGMAIVCLIYAQQQVPEIVAPAGGIDESKTISLEWTLGETNTETVFTDQTMISQGFHQPILRVVKLPDETSLDINNEIQIFPNPVESILGIKISKDHAQEAVEFNLLNMEGQLIIKLPVARGVLSTQIDMSQLAPGSYFLKCVRKDKSQHSTFKIIKS